MWPETPALCDIHEGAIDQVRRAAEAFTAGG